jgi:hypothetical protein
MLGSIRPNTPPCVGAGNTQSNPSNDSTNDRGINGASSSSHCDSHLPPRNLSPAWGLFVGFRLAELSEQALEKLRNKRARLALEGDRYVEAQDPLTDEE